MLKNLLSCSPFVLAALVTLFSFSSEELNAQIEKYFKKIEDKSGIHSMRNVDFIYLINLDHRTEKLQTTLDQLTPYGITPFRFSAVNGWKLSFEAINDLGVHYRPGMQKTICTVFRHQDGNEYNSFEVIKEEGVAYYCHSLSRGAIGCFMSHLSILQDAYNSGYETIWVIEDDIRVVENPLMLSSLIDKLDALTGGTWDILFTDNEIKAANGEPMPSCGIRPKPGFRVQHLDYYTARYKIDEAFTKIGMRFGSHSMIIRRSGIKKILDYVKTYKIYFPYDVEYYYVPEIQLYQCNRDIITNIAGGISDNAVSGGP